MDLFKSVLFALTAICAVSAFDLTLVTPKASSVKEGESVVLSCTVDTYYEWCKFEHAGKKCDYEWRKKEWNITLLDCSDFNDKIRYVGDYNNYNCAIELKNVTPEDAGEWTCEMESYHAGRYRGYGYQKTGSMMIDVEVKTTTTTTTTTTSTTKPSTVKKVVYPEYEYEGTDQGTADQQSGVKTNNEIDGDENEDSSGNAAYIVIVVIIIILIAAVIVLVGLHYKRKLPESFYNLGGLIKGDKQWRPVLAKDADDDLKKHPTIVKNGGANGTANGTNETGTNEGEDANINPELSTVTWTSENKKIEADMHLNAEEQKPLQDEKTETLPE